MAKYYAVAKGRVPGVYNTWSECQAQTAGFRGAVFQSFPTKAAAEAFVASTVAAQAAAVPEELVDVHIYTDGSSTGGVSGYGFVVITKGWIDNLYGRVPYESHNDVSELYAVYQALLYCQNLGMPLSVMIHSDSTYVVDVYSTWINGWRLNGWRTSKGEIPANIELVKASDVVLQDLRSKGFTVSFKHVKGHEGHQHNEKADQLANMGRSVINGPIRESVVTL